MEPWNLILPLLGWVVLVALFLLAVMVVTALIQTFVSSVRLKTMPHGVLVRQKTLVFNPEVLFKTVRDAARDKYDSDFFLSEDKQLAFIAGADYMLDLITGEIELKEGAVSED